MVHLLVQMSPQLLGCICLREKRQINHFSDTSRCVAAVNRYHMCPDQAWLRVQRWSEHPGVPSRDTSATPERDERCVNPWPRTPSLALTPLSPSAPRPQTPTAATSTDCGRVFICSWMVKVMGVMHYKVINYYYSSPINTLDL